jgi:hypothetical protein
MFAGAFIGQLATVVGMMAGGIAVGGFLGQARPSLLGEPDAELRRATTVGGLFGFTGAILAVVLSSIYVNFLS